MMFGDNIDIDYIKQTLEVMMNNNEIDKFIKLSGQLYELYYNIENEKEIEEKILDIMKSIQYHINLME